MSKVNTINLIDSVRGVLSPEEYIELASIASLLESLSVKQENSPKYVDRILRAGENSLAELEGILVEIRTEYPYFKGVFEQLDSIMKLNVSTMSRFWFEFKSAILDAKNVRDWFEEFIELYNSSLLKYGGMSSSPEVINELAINLLNPVEGTFHDSMSGFGGSLKHAGDYAKEKDGTIQLFGQELNKRAWAIAKIRLFISGYEDAEIYKGDIFAEPHFTEGDKLKKFNYVFVDSPFGLEISQYEAVQADRYNRFLYGIPPKRNIEMATLSHVIASLETDGKAVVVVSSGTLFRSGSEEQIRKNIISSDIIEAVIALPGGLYDNTSIPSNLVLLNKAKEDARKERILFINAEEDFTEINRRKKSISKETIKKIVEAVGKGEAIAEFSKYVSLKDIREGNLSPNRYVVSTDMEIANFGKVEFSLDHLNKVQTAPLEELVTFFRGYNSSSKDEAEDGLYKVLKISDVQEGKIIQDKISKYTIDNNAKLDVYRLHKGDVIISIRGQAIKVAEVTVEDDNLLLSQNFMGIRCGEKLNPTYLKMYLESPVGQFLLSSRLTGSVIPTLNKNDLKKLDIPVKSAEEQNKIVATHSEKENTILMKIEELQRELFDSKINVYQQMGLSEVFTIKN